MICYVVTLRKYKDDSVFRRVSFATKELAMNYIKLWSNSKKAYLSSIKQLDMPLINMGG